MRKQVDTKRKMAPERAEKTMDVDTPIFIPAHRRTHTRDSDPQPKTMMAGSFRDNNRPTTAETNSDESAMTKSTDEDTVHRWQTGDQLEIPAPRAKGQHRKTTRGSKGASRRRYADTAFWQDRKKRTKKEVKKIELWLEKAKEEGAYAQPGVESSQMTVERDQYFYFLLGDFR